MEFLRLMVSVVLVAAGGCGDDGGSDAGFDSGGGDSGPADGAPPDTAPFDSGPGGTCAFEIRDFVTDEERMAPHIGFRVAPMTEVTARVSAVAASSMAFEPPAGAILNFDWRGQALSDFFALDDMVTLSTDGLWSIVRNDTVQLAAYDERGIGAGAGTINVPGMGPRLRRIDGCDFREPSGQCGEPPKSIVVYGLQVILGTEQIEIGQGEHAMVGDMTLGEWDVLNDLTVLHPGYGTDEGCNVQPAFIWRATAVGPNLDVTP